MSIILTEEQSMFREMVAKYLADNCSLETRQKTIASGSVWRPEVWRDFAELGILGAGFPEELGGFGGGTIEHMIVMEQLGGALALEPYLETAVIGGGFLMHADKALASELCNGISSGDARIAFAYAEPRGRYNLAAIETKARSQGGDFILDGHKAVVIGASCATHLIVTARTSGYDRDQEGISVFLAPIDLPGLRRRDYSMVDGHGASDVYFDQVRVPQAALIGPLDQGFPIVQQVVDSAIAAICAEAVGVMRRLLDDTVAYTKQRKQFGQPIANFQVLKHRMVDMLINVEEAISMTHMATLALAKSGAERSRAVSAAKVHVGKACRFVGQNAVQLHGAIGTTDELAVSHYFKRATVLENMFGSVDHHLTRFASIMSAASLPKEIA